MSTQEETIAALQNRLKLYSQFGKHDITWMEYKSACTEAGDCIAALQAEVQRLRATIRRVSDAIAFVEPEDRSAIDAAILADGHLSLRKCAAKHGVGVSVVRTLRVRAALAQTGGDDAR